MHLSLSRNPQPDFKQIFTHRVLPAAVLALPFVVSPLYEEASSHLTQAECIASLRNEYRTAFFGSDTDEDGLKDDLETHLGTNPSAVDTDHDGLSDFKEKCDFDSDPLERDSDYDHISDGEEAEGYLLCDVSKENMITIRDKKLPFLTSIYLKNEGITYADFTASLLPVSFEQVAQRICDQYSISSYDCRLDCAGFSPSFPSDSARSTPVYRSVTLHPFQEVSPPNTIMRYEDQNDSRALTSYNN